MNRSSRARNGIAAGIAGLGLAVGGIAIASADTTTAAAQSSSSSSSSTLPDRPGGQRHEQLAKTLATELGIKQATVQTALDAVRADLRPAAPADGTRPTPPTDAERAAHQKALATALATKLNVSEAKVTAALEVAQKAADADRAEHKTQERADLVTRLDAAVKAGTLTEADKTSVLKAFDADLLGHGGPGGRGGPGGPPPAA
ncbi:MAG: hypothetical protein NTV23_00875 [Propionibacteriales bacterium]|nr:hypothetical protein [Propionibacteriales bacterium]